MGSIGVPECRDSGKENGNYSSPTLRFKRGFRVRG